MTPKTLSETLKPLKNGHGEDIQGDDISSLFNKAIEHHKAGRLGEAEELYVRILEIDRNHADSYHLLGLVSYGVGDLASAEALVRHAISLRNAAPFHFSLGNVMMSAGRLDAAADCYRRAIAIEPDYVQALNNLGVVLLKNGKFDEALPYIEKAIELNPLYADAHNNLGMIMKEKGRPAEAASCFERAIKLKPDYAEAHNNLGIALRMLDRIDEAIEQYEKTIDLKPDYVEAYSNLGNALRDKGKFETSQRQFEKALALNPDHAEAHSNLGNALKDQGHIEQALARYKRAIAIKPDFAVAHFNIGTVYQEIGEFGEAMKYYNQAIAIDPDYAEAHWNQSLVMLTLGDFENGWKKYEWRWRKKGVVMPGYGKPLWDGSPFEGKTLLLHTEQGLGDSLQFIRYAPMVKERGGRVVLCCPPALERLFGMMNLFDCISPSGSPAPEHDIQSPLLSLPMIFGTTLGTIPNSVPYLSPDPKDTTAWAERIRPYGDGFRIGLVWAGNPRKEQPGAHAIDKRRSMKLDQFAPLADIPGALWFSLQKDGEPAEQAKNPPPGMKLIDLMENVKDYADTAAFIANLDLVIGVDTSVIHMAGALGKPVWVLSRFDGCWRWLLDRSDSPWYPSLRLFRQKRPREWGPVVEEVRAELLCLLERKRDKVRPSET